MEYKLHLCSDPFKKISLGNKTIEMRLYDEKRAKYNVGDRLIFINKEDESQVLQAKITALYRFKSFKELYSKLDNEKLGYKASEKPTPDDMLKYYTKESEQKFGVLGIQFELIK